MNILAKTKRFFSPPTQVNGKVIRHPQFQVYKPLYITVRPKWSPRGGGFTKGGLCTKYAGCNLPVPQYPFLPHSTLRSTSLRILPCAAVADMSIF